MITKLIRKALALSFKNFLNEERAYLNEIILDMNNTLDDIKSSKNFLIEKSIRLNAIINEMENAIADMKSIHDDLYDTRMRLQELAVYGLDGMEEADLEVVANKVLRNLITITNDRFNTLERKMDLLLNHHGIGAEDLLVYTNSKQSEEPNMHDGLDDYQKALLAPYDSRDTDKTMNDYSTMPKMCLAPRRNGRQTAAQIEDTIKHDIEK